MILVLFEWIRSVYTILVQVRPEKNPWREIAYPLTILLILM